MSFEYYNIVIFGIPKHIPDENLSNTHCHLLSSQSSLVSIMLMNVHSLCIQYVRCECFSVCVGLLRDICFQFAIRFSILFIYEKITRKEGNKNSWACYLARWTSSGNIGNVIYYNCTIYEKRRKEMKRYSRIRECLNLYK